MSDKRLTIKQAVYDHLDSYPYNNNPEVVFNEIERLFSKISFSTVERYVREWKKAQVAFKEACDYVDEFGFGEMTFARQVKEERDQMDKLPKEITVVSNQLPEETKDQLHRIKELSQITKEQEEVVLIYTKPRFYCTDAEGVQEYKTVELLPEDRPGVSCNLSSPIEEFDFHNYPPIKYKKSIAEKCFSSLPNYVDKLLDSEPIEKVKRLARKLHKKIKLLKGK